MRQGRVLLGLRESPQSILRYRHNSGKTFRILVFYSFQNFLKGEFIVKLQNYIMQYNLLSLYVFFEKISFIGKRFKRVFSRKGFTLQIFIKGCIRYIFAILFYMSKRENLWNKEKCFLFHFKSSLRSWDNQVLNFQVFKFHDVIICLSMKHKTNFTE